MSAPVEIRLNLMLFRVDGIPFGCDADQISRVDASPGTGDETLHWFHRELGFPRPVDYHSPTALTVRGADPSPYRVVIDQLEQIAEVGLAEIRLLPAPVEPFALARGIWGVLPREGRLVLLVDFQLLGKRRGGAPTSRHFK